MSKVLGPSAEMIHKTKLKSAITKIGKARGRTWASSIDAPMMKHMPGKPRKQWSALAGKVITVVPERKFRFISKDAFAVAASGAYARAYSQQRKAGNIYRTHVPQEPKTQPVLPGFTPGAKAMLSHFVQSYAAEVGTYARMANVPVKEGKPPPRINRKMMQLGIEIADSKIFDTSSVSKSVVMAAAKKVAKKKKDKESAGDGAGKATKEKSDGKKEKKKGKKAKAASTPMEEDD
tara:strand:+ start:393 stop:1094 length:702 start_codon:yes stop_codon:yes gene_type:complete